MLLALFIFNLSIGLTEQSAPPADKVCKKISAVAGNRSKQIMGNVDWWLDHAGKAPLLSREEEVSQLRAISAYEMNALKRIAATPYFLAILKRQREAVVLTPSKIRQTVKVKSKGKSDETGERVQSKKLNKEEQQAHEQFLTVSEEFLRLAPHPQTTPEQLQNLAVQLNLARGFLNIEVYEPLIELHNRNLFSETTVEMLKKTVPPLFTYEEARDALSLSQEDLLMARALKGTFAESNLRLVVSIAKDFFDRGLPRIDVIQAGNAGMLTALAKCEPDFGHKFSTSATWWIRNSIQREIQVFSRSIRLPKDPWELVSLISKKTEEFIQTNGYSPSDEELSVFAGIPLVKLKEIRPVRRNQQISLNKPVGEDGSADFGDFVEDANESKRPNQEAGASDQTAYQRELLSKYLPLLHGNGGKVLTYRYGLDGGDALTLEQTGTFLRVTRERIRQIQDYAEWQLKAFVVLERMSMSRKDRDIVMSFIMLPPKANPPYEEMAPLYGMTVFKIRELIENFEYELETLGIEVPAID